MTQVGDAAFHVPEAVQVRVLTPLMLYPCAHEYVACAWYSVPLSVSTWPFTGAVRGPQSADGEQ